MNKKALSKVLKKIALNRGDILCIHSISIEEGNDLARMITGMAEQCFLPKGLLIIVLREGDSLESLSEANMSAAGWYKK